MLITIIGFYFLCYALIVFNCVVQPKHLQINNAVVVLTWCAVHLVVTRHSPVFSVYYHPRWSPFRPVVFHLRLDSWSHLHDAYCRDRNDRLQVFTRATGKCTAANSIHAIFYIIILSCSRISDVIKISLWKSMHKIVLEIL